MKNVNNYWIGYYDDPAIDEKRRLSIVDEKWPEEIPDSAYENKLIKSENSREKARERAKQWRADNPDKCAKYTQENREKQSERWKRWKKANIEKVRQYYREYNKKRKVNANR